MFLRANHLSHVPSSLSFSLFCSLAFYLRFSRQKHHAVTDAECVMQTLFVPRLLLVPKYWFSLIGKTPFQIIALKARHYGYLARSEKLSHWPPPSGSWRAQTRCASVSYFSAIDRARVFCSVDYKSELAEQLLTPDRVNDCLLLQRDWPRRTCGDQ